MLTTTRKRATVGEILVEAFLRPPGLTQTAPADATGVQRKHVTELCNERRKVTAPTALILARVFGNSRDFWLNLQRRTGLCEVLHSPRELAPIESARPLAERRADAAVTAASAVRICHLLQKTAVIFRKPGRSKHPHTAVPDRHRASPRPMNVPRDRLHRRSISGKAQFR